MAEQKLDQKEKLQLLLCDCHHLATKKMITIQRSKMSVQKFIDIARKDMGLTKTVKIYRENGVELSSSNLYRIVNNDALYISNGLKLEESIESVSLCVMGAGAVGKSAITLRFIQGQFVANYDPTIEDAYRKQVDVDGNQLLLDILDTAGQEDFECLRTQWMKDKDGFILVFSIIRKTSFTQLQDYYDGITELYDDGNVPPIILVGNKVDLDKNHIAYDPSVNDENEEYSKSSNDSAHLLESSHERQVTFEEAVEFGRKMGVAHYVETSAKSGYNVENCVGKMVRHLINKKYRMEQKKGGRKTTTNESKWWSKCQIL